MSAEPTEHEWFMRLSAQLRACGEREVGSVTTGEDLMLYSLCAGVIAGLSMRVEDLEKRL